MKVVINPLSILKFLGITIFITVGAILYVNSIVLIYQSIKYSGEKTRTVKVMEKGRETYLFLQDVDFGRSRGFVNVTQEWYDKAKVGDIAHSELTFSQVISTARGFLTFISWIGQIIFTLYLLYKAAEYIYIKWENIISFLDKDFTIQLEKKTKKTEIFKDSIPLKIKSIKETKPHKEIKIISKIKDFFMEEE